MTLFRELRGLPRPLWALFVATLVNRMGTMALPFLVLYLTEHLAFTPEQAAAMLGVYGVGSLAVTPWMGWVCDRLGAVRVMLAALFLSGAILLLYPLATTLAEVAAITLGLAVTAEAFRPARLLATTYWTPPEKTKSGFAVIRLAHNLGMSVGPAVGGLLARHSFPTLFLVDGATTLLAGGLLAFALKGRARDGIAEGAPVGPAALGAALADPRLLFFLFAMVPVGMVFFQHESTMPLHLVRNLGLAESTYGLLFTLNTLLIIFLEIPLNLKTAHWSHRRALALGSTLFAVGFGAMALARDTFGVALTIVIWTFGEMILFPASAAFVTDLAPAGRRGSYMGLYTAGFGIPFILGPWAGTWVMERWGAVALWTVCLFWGLLSTLCFLRVRPPRLSVA